jgi:hypothetical protein
MSCPSVDEITLTGTAFFDWMNGTRVNCPESRTKEVYAAITKLRRPVGGATTTEISGLNTEIATSQKILEQKQRDATIAKDRASTVVRPELNSSYYDSWFPLNRPLKRAAIPVLVFFASLFITISFSLFLGLIGIRSHFYVIIPYDSRESSMTRPFFILLAFTVILFAFTIYAFMQ